MSADRDPGTEADTGGQRRLDGPRIVVALYVLLTAVGFAAGILVATFVDGLRSPALYGFIELPPTVVGFSLYGGLTIATVLGVPLAFVIYVSRRIDDPDAIE